MAKGEARLAQKKESQMNMELGMRSTASAGDM